MPIDNYQFTQIMIQYDCKKSSSGYIIDGEDRKAIPNRWKTEHRTKGYFPTISTKFKVKTLWEFLALDDSEKPLLDVDEQSRRRFYDKWGPLQDPLETEAVFISLARIIWESERSRKNFKIPKMQIPFDGLVGEWSYSENGKLVPTLKPVNLFDALKIQWMLSANGRVEPRKCKYFEETQVQVKGCSLWFEPSRRNQVFCSSNCRSNLNMKEMRERKKLRDKKGKENNGSA